MYRRLKYMAPVLILFISVLTAQLYAGNDEGVPVGNEASVLAAAITATTRDGSAGYYNPAGLAQINRASLDVTADVYGLRLVRSTKALTSNNNSASAQAIDWILVPSAATYSRRFGNFAGSFGIFVPRTTDILLRTELIDDSNTRWLTSTRQESHDTFYTLSVGWSVNNDLRLGISGLGVYTSEVTGFQLSGGQDGTGNEFLTFSSLANQSEYGIALMGGLQYDFSKHFTLGVSLRSPSMTMLRISEQSEASSNQVGTQEPSFESKLDQDRGFDIDLTTPFKLRTGIAYDQSNWTWMLDTDLAPPLNRIVLSDRKWLFNVRVATKYKVSEKVSFGGGLFTDRSAERERPIHYYGLTIGTVLKHELNTDSSSPVTLGTTISGRYAFGTGLVDGFKVPDLNFDEPFSVVDGRLTAHELSAVLGGSVYF